MPAQSQDMVCQSAPDRRAIHDPSQARASYPIMVRNTFTADGTGPDGLTLSVHLPGTLTPGCPTGTIQPMRGIRALGDGMFEGYVVHNSMSYHSHLFGETFPFTTDQVWDWDLYTDDTEGRLYGAYWLRFSRQYLSVDGGGILLQLMPDAMPSDWQ